MSGKSVNFGDKNIKRKYHLNIIEILIGCNGNDDDRREKKIVSAKWRLKNKNQTSYDNRNLYKLMNCWVNTTCFVKNHQIQVFEKNTKQIPWKHEYFSSHEDCISCFFFENKRIICRYDLIYGISCYCILIKFFKYFTEAYLVFSG